MIAADVHIIFRPKSRVELYALDTLINIDLLHGLTKSVDAETLTLTIAGRVADIQAVIDGVGR